MNASHGWREAKPDRSDGSLRSQPRSAVRSGRVSEARAFPHVEEADPRIHFTRPRSTAFPTGRPRRAAKERPRPLTRARSLPPSSLPALRCCSWPPEPARPLTQRPFFSNGFLFKTFFFFPLQSDFPQFHLGKTSIFTHVVYVGRDISSVRLE